MGFSFLVFRLSRVHTREKFIVVSGYGLGFRVFGLGVSVQISVVEAFEGFGFCPGHPRGILAYLWSRPRKKSIYFLGISSYNGNPKPKKVLKYSTPKPS